ncbi:ornithine cyclodeaminase family protein [Aliamphritea hakodatensis]|uniref:ornithine cyclodeaminase family protein n=1 Tax=Aliamphritea hakodatensis TaxID=2895352 RepID=UPI0022FD9CE4|nr:ornithine cyclodeaminase family protein [Aliamphritea hakodatensis]
MQIFNAKQTAELLPYPHLIAQLSAQFRAGLKAPDRHHHDLPMQHEANGTLLLMPAWNNDIGCIKIVTVTPGNSARSLPAIAGNVLIFRRDTGAHVALLDGAVLTARRTAAASALAADKLARKDARHLLILGAGKVAQQLPDAFAAVRPIDQISIWNNHPDGAEALAASLRQQGKNATAVHDLQDAVSRADIITAATLAQQPLIKGEWLQPGQHLDLIGAFTPTMREADDQALQRSSIYIDTAFACQEAGELKIPLVSGAISQNDICGDLYSLTANPTSARRSSEEITLFKSVGNAVMDLSAALTAINNGGDI